jgi:NAD(P)-dependent dehydrogenase (short-subunit alcohol dehydrogenase family)
MKERRWGRIIYTASLFAFTSVAGRSVYSATKSALLGLARANAIDLGPFGITMNCLAPGPIATETSAVNFSQQARDCFAERTALGRWGEPRELVGPSRLLASEACSSIAGTALVVDGGAIVKTLQMVDRVKSAVQEEPSYRVALSGDGGHGRDQEREHVLLPALRCR